MKLQKSLIMGGVALSFFTTAASAYEINKVGVEEYKKAMETGQGVLDDLVFESLTVHEYNAPKGDNLKNIKSNTDTFLNKICPGKDSIEDEATKGAVERTCYALEVRTGLKSPIAPKLLTESDVDALLASAGTDTAQQNADTFYDQHFMMFELKQPTKGHIKTLKANAVLFDKKVCGEGDLKSDLGPAVFKDTSFMRVLRRMCTTVRIRQRNTDN